MKISSIIAEYNPFHNGHAYHIEQTRLLSGCTHVIAVMSGSFTQRGEPAVFDKWLRTRAALAGGADMVIELPTLFACASAERFAAGAVSITGALGCVSTLSFGSECADMALLRHAAELLADEPAVYKSALADALARGMSFPAARAAAISSLEDGEAIAALLSQPNSILAVEYLKAVLRQGCAFECLAIPRRGEGYLGENAAAEFPSAMAVRKAIFAGDAGAFSGVPPQAASLYNDAAAVSPDAIYPYVLYRLRGLSAPELASYEGVGEGLENTLLSAAAGAADYEGFIARLKSKRYTRTRLNRILCAIFLGIKKRDVCAEPNARYARVLGVKKSALPLLSHLCAHACVPVITQPQPGTADASLRLDMLASDLHALLSGRGGPAARDLTEGLIVL